MKTYRKSQITRRLSRRLFLEETLLTRDYRKPFVVPMENEI
ncbi:MAG TPA: hypothetical protein VMX36_11415 [Sedimentisphaerales bacterium]|nr:hypothetical protein [Sedimentisphaerales bacterium]